MTHQAPLAPTIAAADPGRQLAQLRQVLTLVERIAGRSDAGTEDMALDEAAKVSTAYGDALPIVQRRFDALAAETVAWAAAGVEALTLARGTPTAAAGRLAEELAPAVAELLRLLRL
ncbi:hypothetical protein [Allosphingosinicella sp.]|uniref:hypothetical protein n=1 Tax=Allosphingosinicella sp. TaxID=2823234 RepID=UPI002EF49730